jgi:hypothetical protein
MRPRGVVLTSMADDNAPSHWIGLAAEVLVEELSPLRKQ